MYECLKPVEDFVMKFKEEMHVQMNSRRQSEIGGEMLISDDEITSISPMR